MLWFRPVLTRLREELLLLALLIALPLLFWAAPLEAQALPRLVDWKTIAALAGLMVLSRGLEDSGCLARAGTWLLRHMRTERALALCLVLFAAALSAVVTNDVALFISVPLTLGLGRAVALPLGRLVIFQALAVNTGSSLSPVGNPQNLFLWQSTGVGFTEFLSAMAPLSLSLLLLLAGATALAFVGRPLALKPAQPIATQRRPLMWLSLISYPVFLVSLEMGYAGVAAIAVLLLYLALFPRVLMGVDWLLLAVFILMFVDLGLLARLPAVAAPVQTLQALPGGDFTAGVVVSQLLSNVPATIFLEEFTDNWRLLAWGVNVGGFGLAIGSLANLIALRLARQPGLWREFHQWSLPALVVSCVAGIWLIARW